MYWIAQERAIVQAKPSIVPKLMHSASLRPSLFKIRHRRNAGAALQPIESS